MDLPSWLLPVFVGIGLGAIASVIFGVYGKHGANSVGYQIFGLSSSTIVTDVLIAVLVAGVVALSALSAFVKDLAYPISYPLEFTAETFLFAIPPSLVLLMMAQFRTGRITASNYAETAALAAKFGLFHVILQFSGFYSTIFPFKA